MKSSRIVLAAASFGALVGSVSSLSLASAQVTYRPHPAPDLYAPLPYSDPSAYDQAYGTRPSFEILPTPYGYAPGVRVVARCLYPDGWNVTDFGRDINGIPPGINHTCPDAGQGAHVRARF